MRLTFDHTPIEINRVGKDYLLTLGDQTMRVEVLHSENGRLVLQVEGQRRVVHVSLQRAKRWVTVDGQTFLLVPAAKRPAGGPGQERASRLVAPMPGQVRSVNVQQGETVNKGQTLLVLEAMKMEIRIQAPAEGVVSQLLVRQGQTVEREQTLIHFQPIIS
ncbi:MAG: biotin/lipoyl-containing protein [Anaerolineae bacterium]